MFTKHNNNDNYVHKNQKLKLVLKLFDNKLQLLWFSIVLFIVQIKQSNILRGLFYYDIYIL